MLSEGTFACSFSYGVALCKATTPSAEAIYQQLALRVKTALSQMARAGINPPVQDITIGPTIGAAMVLAVQSIVGGLAVVVPPPPGVAAILDTQQPPHMLIAIVGAHADDIRTYIDQALMARPDAFTAAQQPPPPMGSPAQQAVKFFTKDRIVALGTGAIVIGSLIWLARSSDKRLSGKVDRGPFLFPGQLDSEDADDDDGDDTADYDDEPTAPPKVIDAESVEVPPPAA